MGEYATRKSDGQSIKIGTCEDMYYLRFDQATQVRHESGNVDPIKDAAELRFRFPFPDEDTIQPGEFENYHKGVTVPDMTPGTGVEHYSIQFSNAHGYLVSLPCPESGDITMTDSHGVTSPLKIHRNGFNGSVQLVAQKYRPNIGLVPILRCACGAMWRVEDRSDIEEIAVKFRSAADHLSGNDGRRGYWHAIADRILAGLTVKAA